MKKQEDNLKVTRWRRSILRLQIGEDWRNKTKINQETENLYEETFANYFAEEEAENFRSRKEEALLETQSSQRWKGGSFERRKHGVSVKGII